MTTNDHQTNPSPRSKAGEVLPMLAEISRAVAEVAEGNLGEVIFRVLRGVRALAGLRRGFVELTDTPFDDYYRLTVDGDPPGIEEVLIPGADRDLPHRPAPEARLDDASPVTPRQRVVTKHVIAAGRKLGELCVVSATEEAVWETADGEDLLGSLASLVAVALERCARQREASQLREWLNAFSRVFEASRIPGSASRHEDLLQEIADNALRLTKANFVVLYEYFEEQGDVRLPPTVAGYVKDVQVLCNRSVAAEHKRSAVFRILQQQQLPFYAEAATRDWQAAGLLDGSGGEGSFFARESVLSSAGLPLRVEKQRVGVLFVNYRREFAFPEDFRDHLELYANQAALAIGNARFFQRSQRYSRDLEAINRIGRELCSAVSRDIGEIGRLIFERTREVIPTCNFFLCIREPDDRFSIPFQRDLSDERESIEVGGEPDLHRGLTGYVCRTGRPLIADRARIDELYADGSAQLVGQPSAVWLGAPLRVRDEVIGALVVQDYSDAALFNAEHLKLLEAVAYQAAIAIDNYQLRKQARTRGG